MRSNYSKFFKRGKYNARRANRFRRRRVLRKRRKGGGLRAFKKRARMAVGVSKRDMNTGHTSILREKSVGYRNTHPIATLALYGCDCTRIDKSSGAFERSNRMYQQVDYRGVKYEFLIRNNMPDPAVFNYAVISFKNGAYPLEDTTWPAEPYQVPTLAADGFFRWNGDSRDENYDNGLSAVTINYAPISTDQYNVHMHKRTTLSGKPGGGDWTFTYANNYRRIKGYIPIKRILRYNDDAGTSCETPIYLVYWISPFHADVGGAKILTAAYVQQYHVAYFKQVTG